MKNQFKKITISVSLILTTLFCFQSLANDLEVTNPFNAIANIESEHFNYWYDDKDSEVDPSLLTSQLDDLEIIYEKLIVQSGFKSPITTFKFNIYMSEAGGSYDRGESSPHVDSDPEGHLFIHMSKYDAAIADYYQYTRALLAHEFFHAIQAQYDNSIYDIWYIEGSASWISYYVENDTGELWSIDALAKTPELTLTYSDYGDFESDEVWHMYATSYFFYWLSQATNLELIKEHLLYAEQSNISDADESSLKSLESFTKEKHNLDLKSLYSEFTARNILWDYTFKQNILRRFENKEFEVGDNVTNEHTILSNTWHEVKQQEHYGAPQGWGASYIKIDTTQIDEFDLSFWGEEQGTFNSNAQWHLTLVKESTNNITYQTIDLTSNNHVDALSIDSKDLDAVYLSINAFTEISSENDNEISAEEVFNYAYQFSEKGQTTNYKTPPTAVQPMSVVKNKQGGAIHFFGLFFLSLAIIYRK